MLNLFSFGFSSQCLVEWISGFSPANFNLQLWTVRVQFCHPIDTKQLIFWVSSDRSSRESLCGYLNPTITASLEFQISAIVNADEHVVVAEERRTFLCGNVKWNELINQNVKEWIAQHTSFSRERENFLEPLARYHFSRVVKYAKIFYRVENFLSLDILERALFIMMNSLRRCFFALALIEISFSLALCFVWYNFMAFVRGWIMLESKFTHL